MRRHGSLFTHGWCGHLLAQHPPLRWANVTQQQVQHAPAGLLNNVELHCRWVTKKCAVHSCKESFYCSVLSQSFILHSSLHPPCFLHSPLSPQCLPVANRPRPISVIMWLGRQRKVENKVDGGQYWGRGGQLKPLSLTCYLKVTPFLGENVYTALSLPARGVH